MKKFFFLSLMSIILGCLVVSCTQPATTRQAQEENVKHFRHILFSETPWDVFKGTHPITSDEAQHINNYKFTYDDQQRLVAVEFCRGDVLLGYSDLGAARIEISFDGDQEVHHYFDENNQPTDIQGGVFKSVYQLDDNDMRTALKFYDREGNPTENRNKIASYKWEKLPDGMIKENRYNLLGMEVILNEFCPFYELRFRYDDRGFVTRMANYEADTLYNCIADNCGDIGVSYFTFKSNDHGDLEEFTVYNTTGQLSNLYWGWARFINKVDENGNVVESAYFDQDNEYLGGKSLPVRQYVYDEHGSLVEMIMMDKDRNVTNHPSSGSAYIKYTYDDKGHPVDTLKLDKDMAVL